MQLKRFKLVAIYYNLIRFSSLVPILTNINYYININLQRKKKEETILWNKIQLINLFMCFLLFSFTQSLKGIFPEKL